MLINPKRLIPLVLLMASTAAFAACDAKKVASEIQGSSFYYRLLRDVPNCPLEQLGTVIQQCPSTTLSGLYQDCQRLGGLSAERKTCQSLQRGLLYKRIQFACRVLQNQGTFSAVHVAASQPLASASPQAPSSDHSAAAPVRKAISLGFP